MALLSVPLKTIIAYWADVQNEANLVTTLTSQGYAICDGSTLDSSHQDINVGGTYTLPDLRNKFLLGADITKTAGQAGAAVGSGNESIAAGAPGPKGTGGQNSTTLTTPQLPSHSHNSVGGGTFVEAGGAGGGVATVGAGGSALNGASGSTGASGSGSAHESRGSYTGIVWAMKVKF